MVWISILHVVAMKLFVLFDRRLLTIAFLQPQMELLVTDVSLLRFSLLKIIVFVQWNNLSFILNRPLTCYKLIEPNYAFPFSKSLLA